MLGAHARAQDEGLGRVHFQDVSREGRSVIGGPARMQVEGTGRVQLSRTVYNFTDAQDVRVLVGYRAHVSDTGRVVGVRAYPARLPASCPTRAPVQPGARI